MHGVIPIIGPHSYLKALFSLLWSFTGDKVTSFLGSQWLLLSIVINLNSTVVWMVSILHLIASSSIVFFQAVTNTPETIGITVILMSHSFLLDLWQDLCICLSFCFLLFQPCKSAGMEKRSFIFFSSYIFVFLQSFTGSLSKTLDVGK